MIETVAHSVEAGDGPARPGPARLAGRSILLCLEMAGLGTSGIPNETRILTSILVESRMHRISGMLMEASGQFTARVLRNCPDRMSELEAAHYLVGMAGQETPLGFGLLPRWRRILWRLDRVYRQALSGYRLRQLPRGAAHAAIWRLLYSRTLDPSARAALDRIDYFASQLNRVDVLSQLRMPLAPPIRLRTEGFHAAVFHDSRPLVLAPETARVIRYHDAIPITHPDLLGDGEQTLTHYRLLKAAARDSWFVCNSEATRRELVSIMPALADRSVTIPCAQSPARRPVAAAPNVRDVIRLRASRLQIELSGKERGLAMLDATLRKWLPLQPFILCVAALEPKKNVVGMIRGYERLLALSPAAPPLVLVGKPSWNYDADVRAITPHIHAGRLIHLEDVPPAELDTLFGAASVCLYASHAEGFGYPPIEALRMGTPSIVSDLPALRETCGTAALYVDPHDPGAIGDALAGLLDPVGGLAIRNRVLADRDAVLRRYHPDVIAGAWNGFLAEVRPLAPARRA